LRDCFHHRGDSLWWFTELYLHREGRVPSWLETLRAAERCLDLHQPDSVGIDTGSTEAAVIVSAVAGRRGVAVQPIPAGSAGSWSSRWRLEARAAFYTARAHFARPRRRDGGEGRGGVAAFVHSAFWRSPPSAGGPRDGADRPEHLRGLEGEEGYIGPVLEALGRRLPQAALTLIGVGPRVNFRARRWRRTVAAAGAPPLPFAPVEAFADARAIAPSLAVWQRRHEMERRLLSSATLREASRLAGYDLWPLLEPELRGIVELQWPWSARAMDEAGAVLDALEPAGALTYAEAGGWGRAIVLEARRRGIPSFGLQHGFIYRHWLNYLHEPDEMAPSRLVPSDAGFPRPTQTLVFDRYAEEHLRQAGHFADGEVVVTGNPRLDALAAAAAAFDGARRDAMRRSVRAPAGAAIVMVVAKYTQIRHVLRQVAEAAGAVAPAVHLVVKCHPAETPAPYVRALDGFGHVSVVPASADLAGWLAVARGLVTVNSTAAIDALVLGVPSLVVDLPNNLSPFVEAGIMLGAGTPEAIRTGLSDLVAEGSRRSALLADGLAFLSRYGIRADGRAAERAADAIQAGMSAAMAGLTG
jgi:hypothetical protein